MSKILQFPTKKVKNGNPELDSKIQDLLNEWTIEAIVLSLLSVADDDEKSIIAPSAKLIFDLDFAKK